MISAQRWIKLHCMDMINQTVEEGTGRSWNPPGNPNRCRCCPRLPDSDSWRQAAGNILAAALNTTGGKIRKVSSRKLRWTEAGMSAVAADGEAADGVPAKKQYSGTEMETARMRPAA